MKFRDTLLKHFLFIQCLKDEEIKSLCLKAFINAFFMCQRVSLFSYMSSAMLSCMQYETISSKTLMAN